jgi:hypothetical protein
MCRVAYMYVHRPPNYGDLPTLLILEHLHITSPFRGNDHNFSRDQGVADEPAAPPPLWPKAPSDALLLVHTS